MFIESTSDYTKEVKSANTEFFQGFFFKPANIVSNYTCGSFILLLPEFSYTGVKKRMPAPENLKKAMFKMFSKGIAKALE